MSHSIGSSPPARGIYNDACSSPIRQCCVPCSSTEQAWLSPASARAGGAHNRSAFLAAIHANPLPRAVLSPHWDVFVSALRFQDTHKWEAERPRWPEMPQRRTAPLQNGVILPGIPVPGKRRRPRLRTVPRPRLPVEPARCGCTRPCSATRAPQRLPSESHPPAPRHARLAPRAARDDSAVPTDSSKAMHARLRAAKVESVLRIVDGLEHSSDLKDGVGATFDEAVEGVPTGALLDA